MQIRTIRPQDVAQAAAGEAACFPAAEAASPAAIAARAAAFPGHFWVAEEKGEIRGFVNGFVTDSPVIQDEMYEDPSLHNPAGRYQAVFGLDVLPAWQGRGIARQLLCTLIDAARSQGRAGVILTCKEHMIPFYEKFGFCSQGLSQSVHGGAAWYDMLLTFARQPGKQG